MAGFQEMWKKAKVAYEDKTKEPKPSKTFLGIRTGSGIEASLTALDGAKTPEQVAKASGDFQKAAKAFAPLVEKRVKEVAAEKDKKRSEVVATASKALMKALGDVEAKVVKDSGAIIDNFISGKVAEKSKEIAKLNSESVLSHPVYGPMFKAYMKKTFADENVDFLLALKAKKNPEAIFKEFVAEKAPRVLNGKGFEKIRDAKDPNKMMAKPDFSILATAVKQNVSGSFKDFQPIAAKEVETALKKQFGRK